MKAIYKELEEAVLLGDIPRVQSLINEDINLDFVVDKYGRTIIYDAIVKGHEKVVEILCNANAKINHQDRKGKTPLHFAAIHKRTKSVKTLLDYGVDINLKDENGNTALFDAIFYCQGDVDIIKVLLDKGADYETPNYFGVSPKKLAVTIANFNVGYLFK